MQHLIQFPDHEHIVIHQGNCQDERRGTYKFVKDEYTDGEAITVEAYCHGCKATNRIGPHTPIHTMQWMRENWNEIRPNHFRVEGFCSRQCEMKNN